MCSLVLPKRACRPWEAWDASHFGVTFAALSAEVYVAPYYVRLLLARMRPGKPQPPPRIDQPRELLARLWQQDRHV